MMAMQIQALVSSPVGPLANGSRRTTITLPFGGVPPLEKHFSLKVKCMAKQDAKNKMKDALSSSKSAPTVPENKVRTKFSDLFAFSGPAPERINGRLAMIGFVAALAVELSKGTDLFDQISNGGAQWFLGTTILLSVASLVPFFRGQSPEEETDGLMNSDAELWNGRFAMLGIVALAVTELVKGGALL